MTFNSSIMLNTKHLIILLATLSFNACQIKNVNQAKESNQIFLCGTTPESRAFYYFNGTQEILSPESEVSSALAIEVKDGIIYCGGSKASSNGNCLAATLWKDGKAIELTDGKNHALMLDFFIKDEYIWCAGVEQDGDTYQNDDYEYIKYNRAKIWCVRGEKVVKTITLTKGSSDAKAQSLYVDSNNNVHVAGYDNKYPGSIYGACDTSYDARYWVIDGQNGTILKKELLSKISGMGTAIWGKEADIMIAGHIDDDLHSSGGWDALYWKDGWARNLTSDYETVIEDGCFYGNDWYMCGHSRDSYALYYKNGELNFLTDKNKEYNSKTYAIAAANSDIYMAGYIESTSGQRMNGYWKNDKFIKIDELFGTPKAIYVIPSDVKPPVEKRKSRASNEEQIHISGRYSLKILPDKTGYNLYTEKINKHNKYAPVKVSDIVFTGEVEPLNMQILGDKEYVTLHSHSGKYLWDTAEECFMLDGNCYEKFEKDNDGGLCVLTKDGRYHISDTDGLPGKVEKYYRSGTYHDMFIYKANGKWGVYSKLVKYSGYSSIAKRKYVEILPAIYDKIRYISGDGANHFVCQRNGVWEIRDVYGRKRRMECSCDIWELNTSFTLSGDDCTSSYISKINSMLLNVQEKYSSFFKTNYSSIGEHEAYIVYLEYHERSWQSIFYYGDRSESDPPGWEWTEEEKQKWEYGY